MDEPTEITRRIYTTGKVGKRIEEQALIAESPSWPVLVTGCSHPGEYSRT